MVVTAQLVDQLQPQQQVQHRQLPLEDRGDPLPRGRPRGDPAAVQPDDTTGEPAAQFRTGIRRYAADAAAVSRSSGGSRAARGVLG
jgi:hypothetical protein